MLSSITPFGERSRGHRYAVTATWFVVGALVGGITLGAGTAVLSLVVSGLGVPSNPVAVSLIAAAFASAAAALDSGLFGDRLPVVRRQVDEGWLSRYRPWFYGAGFGWQIGVGVVTYVMTAAVFLLVVLGALTGRPLAAVALGALFGLARGLTVLLTSRARTPERLRSLHLRLTQVGPTVRGVMIAVEIGVAAAALAEEWPLAGTLVAAAAVASAAVTWSVRRRISASGEPEVTPGDNGQDVESRAVDSGVVDGRVVDGRVVDGRVVDGRVVDGRAVSGRLVSTLVVKS
jgi:MFS family permease